MIDLWLESAVLLLLLYLLFDLLVDFVLLHFLLDVPVLKSEHLIRRGLVSKLRDSLFGSADSITWRLHP